MPSEPGRASVPIAAGLALAGVMALPAAAAPAEDAFRHSAPIEITQPAPFVRLPLGAATYAKVQQTDLRDLRIVDAAGERVPFALLPPRAARTEPTEQLAEVRLYPLPPRPAAGQAWPAPVEVVVQGGRISVRQPAGKAVAEVKNSPGWLFDLGDPAERKSDQAARQALRLRWSGPAEFSAGYRLETSADLRQWRAGGTGQVLAFASSNGALTQPNVDLPADTGRFVRLVWAEPGFAPALNGAAAVVRQQAVVPTDPPDQIVLSASAEPVPAAADAASAELARRALHFDLGGVLPLKQIDMLVGAVAADTVTTRPSGASGAALSSPSPANAAGAVFIAPVRVQARDRTTEPWRDVGGHVFYRFARDGSSVTSPAFETPVTARYLRIVPDPRSAALDPAQTRLVVQASLASVVFAAQGRAPFTLLAGAQNAPAGALPITTLVPAPDDERARFGKATLGAWRESEDVVRALQSQQRLAAMRPWLLWAVLLAGVAGLGFMVWRLARSAAVTPE